MYDLEDFGRVLKLKGKQTETRDNPAERQTKVRDDPAARQTEARDNPATRQTEECTNTSLINATTDVRVLATA